MPSAQKLQMPWVPKAGEKRGSSQQLHCMLQEKSTSKKGNYLHDVQ